MFILTIYIKKMPGVRSVAMKSIRTTILTSEKKQKRPLETPFPKMFIIHPRIFFLNKNDVEFDFSIGHALVLFPVL